MESNCLKKAIHNVICILFEKSFGEVHVTSIVLSVELIVEQYIRLT